MRRPTLLFVLASVLGACSDEAPPEPQWVVTIATDAPPAPFFDRLLVEVLDDHGDLACGSACRRVFGLADASSWPIVFGVTASAAPTHVRARLHRSDHTGPDGLPLEPMLVDSLGRLPSANGIVRVELDLRMSCFGVASDTAGARTCDPTSGALGAEPMLAATEAEPLAVGSWPPGRPVPCSEEPPEGMVCIPGGTFFLGALLTGSPILVTVPEHLVQLSPFAMDIDEMTVGRVRALARAREIDGLPRTFDRDPSTVDNACTWLGPYNGANDALPVNCILHAYAAAICGALGKRLPTEAELEWAAGNTSLETRRSWSGDVDACANAIVGRGRTVAEGPANSEQPGCRVTGSSTGLLPWGPVAGGSARDVTQLGVKNLGGNVAELASDTFSLYSDACWSSPTTLLVNPRCLAPAVKTTSVVSRGGSWDSFGLSASAISRLAVPRTGSPSLGFRCVKPL